MGQEQKDLIVQVLLTEYEQAQSSAQYHDTLLWTTTSILMGGVVVLLGIAFTGNGASENCLFSVIYCGLAAMLVIANMLLAYGFRTYKVEKYDRCKKIEEDVEKLVQKGTPPPCQHPLHGTQTVCLMWQHRRLPPRPLQGMLVLWSLWLPTLFIILLLIVPAVVKLSWSEMIKAAVVGALFVILLCIRFLAKRKYEKKNIIIRPGY